MVRRVLSWILCVLSALSLVFTLLDGKRGPALFWVAALLFGIFLLTRPRPANP